MSRPSTSALRPSQILFSHSKIRPRFTGCGKTLEETYLELRYGRLPIDAIPAIRVWHDGEKYVAENNRRLFVFRRLEEEGLITEIPVRLERVALGKLNKTYAKTAKVIVEREPREAGAGGATDTVGSMGALAVPVSAELPRGGAGASEPDVSFAH